MCDHDEKPPLSNYFRKLCFGAEAEPAPGSRRRRLWDLDHQCHCPVIGVCLPLDTLRRLVNKVLGGKAVADDYDVHVGAVAECGSRNRLSKALQTELDKRYWRELAQFRQAKSTPAVAELWQRALQAGDVAGTFWAALTHPACDTQLQQTLCRDMHMLQHQAGASARIDLTRFHALQEENAILARELSKVQQRSTQLMAEKSAELAELGAQLMQVRAEHIAKDSRIVHLSEELQALKNALPGLDSKLHLQKKIEQLMLRQADLEAQNAALRQKAAASAQALAAVQHSHAPPAPPAGTAPAPTLAFNQKSVLCVGGRNGNIGNYRDLIERVGGRFSHHDGGLEDNAGILDASLAAADLVICQTGCISHNAYWKVKDFCKRTGKRCVFVEHLSTSSLARGWSELQMKNPAQGQAAMAQQTEGDDRGQR
jgi:hypothetical protein